jgi:hypothetical protein
VEKDSLIERTASLIGEMVDRPTGQIAAYAPDVVVGSRRPIDARVGVAPFMFICPSSSLEGAVFTDDRGPVLHVADTTTGSEGILASGR